MNCNTFIKSNGCLDVDSDDYEEPDNVIELSWICPFCDNTYKEIDGADPLNSYGSFYIVCEGCYLSNRPPFIGIELGERVTDSTELGALEALGEKDGYFIYRCKIVEFTHYNKMEDYDCDTPEFKILEQKWLNGETEWVKFDKPKYAFFKKECYNMRFLVTGGEFSFGFD